MRFAADALADAGWEIEHVELPEFQHVFEVWNRIMCDDIPALLDAVAAVIDPRLVAALEGHIAYPYVTDLSRMAVYPERRRLMRVWRSMFATTPIVVTPVWPEPQFPATMTSSAASTSSLTCSSSPPQHRSSGSRRSLCRPGSSTVCRSAFRSTLTAGMTSTASMLEPPSSRSWAP